VASRQSRVVKLHNRDLRVTVDEGSPYRRPTSRHVILLLSLFPSTRNVRHLPHPMFSDSNPSSTPSNFETLLNAALAKYTKQTGNDLRDHPLASKIDSCDSPDSILDIFQEQARAFDEFRRDDTKLFKCLRPVVNVLHALSTVPILSDSGSFVSLATFLVIYSMYLYFPGVSARKSCFLRYRDLFIRAYLPPYLRPIPCHIRGC